MLRGIVPDRVARVDSSMRSLLLLLPWSFAFAACQAGAGAPPPAPPAPPAPSPGAPTVSSTGSSTAAAPPVASSAATGVPSPRYRIVASSSSAEPVRREAGKVACGRTSCTVGKEICCEAGIDGVCVQIPPGPHFDLTGLDEFCDQRGALLVGCNDSEACGGGEACCEILWGSGANEPIVCTAPRDGERFPCDFREACVPDVPCHTPGADCVEGWCTVSRPRTPLSCGVHTCAAPDEVCCAQPTGGSECMSATQCRDASRWFLACTSPGNCADGEFCAIAPGGGGCIHSWDGMSDVLCRTTQDCPNSFRDQCAGLKKRTGCAPLGAATTKSWPALQGRRACQCQ